MILKCQLQQCYRFSVLCTMGSRAAADGYQAYISHPIVLPSRNVSYLVFSVIVALCRWLGTMTIVLRKYWRMLALLDSGFHLTAYNSGYSNLFLWGSFVQGNNHLQVPRFVYKERCHSCIRVQWTGLVNSTLSWHLWTWLVMFCGEAHIRWFRSRAYALNLVCIWGRSTPPT